MPPKKKAAKPKRKQGKAESPEESKQKKIPQAVEDEPEEDAPHSQDEAVAPKEEHSPQSNTAKKRKSPTSQENKSNKKTKTEKSKPSTKAPRQGTRSSTRTNKPSSSSTSSNPSPTQLITYLLSPHSLRHACPTDELTYTTSHPSHQTYSLTAPHLFTPFQHLLLASLLSKPLSHLLGLRSIRTLLNEPFSLTSPTAITSAGEKRVWEALEKARTQHRQKSAAYIFQMGEMCEGGEGWGEDFEGLRKLGDVDAVCKDIKNKVKGMGGTGAELFLRRVQCCEGWEGVWPFADGKALEAVRGMGLGGVEDAAGLRRLVEDVVEEMGEGIGDMGLQGWDGDVSKEQKLRIAFVVVLERALGASLEGNVDGVLKAAMES